MRIGFTGAGGTGKSTTLAIVVRMLEAFGMGVPVLGSVTRSVFQRRGLTEADQESMSPEDRLNLQMEIFSERRAAEKAIGGAFISDRTLVDHFAYCLFRNYAVIGDVDHTALLDEAVESAASYDALFYFPISFTPPADGLRQAGVAYNYCIDAIISKVIDGVDGVMRVPDGTPLQRATAVFERIRDVTGQ